ncbi:integrase core domain-containing protein [Hymenobacter profundi]|uniref:Integrase core domain-containing protein n=1 Tax=Hymenobacter profundi TaxID=1982110 RepID=A0ABS6WWB1_9BACT|nr:integrase core domain-containing protein [Hymenobacter profundi]
MSPCIRCDSKRNGQVALTLSYPLGSSIPYDNAQAEAGWSTLKTELLPLRAPFASLEEARLEVAYYLDTYFNLDRRHSALGYRLPHQFELDYQQILSYFSEQAFYLVIHWSCKSFPIRSVQLTTSV